MSNEQHIIAGEGAQLENILQANTAIVFVGAYEGLREAYVDPIPVYERVRTDRFVGREWLLERVDEFLARKSGYFKIEAKAGLGKTSFLAHLAKTRGYIHHFAERAPGREGVGRSLKSLSAQLIVRYELGPAAISASAERPDFLETLLFEAAEKRSIRGDVSPIVLVVDALDEAGTPDGLNVLGLPRRLPDGVFIIVTQRPVVVRLETDQVPVVIEIDGNGPDNLRDMRRFLERVAAEPRFAERLASARVRTSLFIDTLLTRCHGEWIYLYYIIEEIESGQRAILPLDDLPHGVQQYYASYWQNWRAKHDGPWLAFDLPLLSTLAASPTDLSANTFAEFAGIAQGDAVRKRLEGEWRPFVATASGEDGIRRYRLYHKSLRDFFEGKADRKHLAAHERQFAEDLAAAVCQAHERIARQFFRAWGGLEKGLPKLQDGTADSETTSYGVLHLAGHLEGAGMVEELHALLALEPRSSWGSRLSTLVRGKRRSDSASIEPVWFAAHQRWGDISTFTADVERAARVSGHAWAKRVRYQLVLASITSMAGKVSPALLGLLLKHGIWSERRALAYARQGWSTTEGELACLPYLSSSEAGSIVNRFLRRCWYRPEDDSLSRVLPFANEGDIESFAARLGREGTWTRDGLLPVLRPRLNPSSGSLIVEAVCRNDSWTWSSLTTLWPFLSEERRTLVRDRLLAAPLDDPDVVAAAPHLPREQLAVRVRELIAQRSSVLIEASARDFALLLAVLEPAELEEQHQKLWEEASQESDDRAFHGLLGLRLAGVVCPNRVEAWGTLLSSERLYYPRRTWPIELLLDHHLCEPALRLAFAGYGWDLSLPIVARRANLAIAERGVVLASKEERTENAEWKALPFWIRLAELGQFERAREALRNCQQSDVRLRLAEGIAPWAPASDARDLAIEALRLSTSVTNEDAADVPRVSLAAQLARYGSRSLKTASWLKLAEHLPRVPQPSRGEVWDAVFEAARRFDRCQQRLDGYALLLAVSTGAQFDSVREVFLEEWRQEKVYYPLRCAALTYLPEPDATRALQEGVSSIWSSSDENGLAALVQKPEWLTAHAGIIWERASQMSVEDNVFELVVAGLRLEDVRQGLSQFADSPRFARLVGRLAQLGYASEALLAARGKEGKVRNESLARLAEHLGSDEIEQLWTVVRGDDWYRWDVVLCLVPWLPDATRAEAVDLAFKRSGDYSGRWIRRLAEFDLDRTVDIALIDVRIHGMRVVRALLATVPSDNVSAQRRVLDGALRHDFDQTRSTALERLAELAPFIANLGGENAIRESLRAIDDVTRWWP